MENDVNIFIIRHGQSEANLKTYNEIKEDCKIKLTNEGHMQAEEAGKFLSQTIPQNEINDSIIISSTYLRALQTTQQINKSLNIKTTKDSRLVEFDRGIFIKCKYSERKLKYPKEFQEYQNMQHSKDKFFAKPPEGESGLDVYRRVRPITFELKHLCKQGIKNVIIVSHNDTMRVLTMALMDYDKLWYYKENAVQNCSIRKIELKDNKYYDKGYIYKGYFDNKQSNKKQTTDLTK